MDKVRISIFVPADHPVAQKPVKERAAYAKELIETALNQKEVLNSINAQLGIICDLLQNGQITPVPPMPDKPVLPAELDRSLNETLHNMLNMFG